MLFLAIFSSLLLGTSWAQCGIRPMKFSQKNLTLQIEYKSTGIPAKADCAVDVDLGNGYQRSGNASSSRASIPFKNLGDETKTVSAQIRCERGERGESDKSCKRTNPVKVIVKEVEVVEQEQLVDTTVKFTVPEDAKSYELYVKDKATGVSEQVKGEPDMSKCAGGTDCKAKIKNLEKDRDYELEVVPVMPDPEEPVTVKAVDFTAKKGEAANQEEYTKEEEEGEVECKAEEKEPVTEPVDDTPTKEEKPPGPPEKGVKMGFGVSDEAESLEIKAGPKGGEKKPVDTGNLTESCNPNGACSVTIPELDPEVDNDVEVTEVKKNGEKEVVFDDTVKAKRASQIIPFLAVKDVTSYTVTVTREKDGSEIEQEVLQSSCKKMHCKATFENLYLDEKYGYKIVANTGQNLRGAPFFAGKLAREQPPLHLQPLDAFASRVQRWVGKGRHRKKKWHTVDRVYETSPIILERWIRNRNVIKQGTIATLMTDNVVQCPEAVPIYRVVSRTRNDQALTTSPASFDKKGKYVKKTRVGYCVLEANQCGSTRPIRKFYDARLGDYFYGPKPLTKQQLNHRFGPRGKKRKTLHGRGIECYAWGPIPSIPLVRIDHKYDFQLPEGSTGYKVEVKKEGEADFSEVTGGNIGNMEKTCNEKLKCRVLLPNLVKGDDYSVKVTPIMASGPADAIVDEITAGILTVTIPYIGSHKTNDYTISIYKAGQAQPREFTTTCKTMGVKSQKDLHCRKDIENLHQDVEYEYTVTASYGKVLGREMFLAGTVLGEKQVFRHWNQYGNKKDGGKRVWRLSTPNHNWKYNGFLAAVLDSTDSCPEAVWLMEFAHARWFIYRLETPGGWKRANVPKIFCVMEKNECFGATQPIYEFRHNTGRHYYYSTKPTMGGGWKRNIPKGPTCWAWPRQ